MELNTLWIGPSLPPVQRLCLASAVATGCTVRLFTYDKLEGVPEGIQIANGNDVLSLDRMVRHRKSQSVALFSDRFRYELLGKGLGAWFDADMLFLKKPTTSMNYLVGREVGTLISAGFIWFEPGLPIIADLRRTALDEHPVPGWYPAWHRSYLWLRKILGIPVHVSDLEWGVIGPDLLTWLLGKHDMLAGVQPVSWSCGLPWGERQKIGLGGYDWRQWINADTVCVHLWNYGLSPEERTRRPEPGSLLYTVAENCGFRWPEDA